MSAATPKFNHDVVAMADDILTYYEDPRNKEHKNDLEMVVIGGKPVKNVLINVHPDKHMASIPVNLLRYQHLFDFFFQVNKKLKDPTKPDNKLTPFEFDVLEKAKIAMQDVGQRKKLFFENALINFTGETGQKLFNSSDEQGKKLLKAGEKFYIRASGSEPGQFNIFQQIENMNPKLFRLEITSEGYTLRDPYKKDFEMKFNDLKVLAEFLRKSPSLDERRGVAPKSDKAYDKGDKKGVNEREKPKSLVSEGRPLILALITLEIDVESLIKNNKLTEDSLLKLLIKKRNEMVTPKEDEALSLFSGKAKDKLIDPEKVAVVVELANKLYRGSQPDAKPAEKPGFAGEKPYVPPVSPHFDAKLGSDKNAKGEAIEITPEAAAKLVEGLVLLKIDITGLDEKILEKRLSDKMEMFTSKRMIVAKEMEAGRQFFDKEGNIDKKKIAAAVKHVANILEKAQKFDQGF